MIAQMTDDSTVVLSAIGKKHFGIFRPGVTVADQILDYAVLRNLWRRDHFREGLPDKWLARYLKQDPTGESWKASVRRLQEFFVIKVSDNPEFCPHRLEATLPPENHSTTRLELLERGRFWAGELCGERHRAGLPVDGL